MLFPRTTTGEAAAKAGRRARRAVIREAENPETPPCDKRAQRRILPRFKTPPEAPLVDRTMLL